jgi:transposase
LGNYLKMADTTRVQALVELGWSYRRIERETGVRRETVAKYDPRRVSKPAKVITGSLDPPPKAATVITGSHSAVEPYREVVEAALAKGLTAQRIWQDLREEHGYGHAYSSVMRFVRTIKRRRPEVADVLEHPPGEEALCGFPHNASSPGWVWTRTVTFGVAGLIFWTKRSTEP